MRYEVWRQDDHGNKFLAGRFDDREAAEELKRTLEARGHKQTYWVEEVPAPGEPPDQ